MNTVISAIFLVVLLAMVFVYPMYFIALSSFGKIMARDHADLVGGQRPGLRPTRRTPFATIIPAEHPC